MIIRDLFEKDIDRPINGVIKVFQTDEESLYQELSEYVVTRELARHFSDFFDNYTDALDIPTDRIGVWISGFFGSGKSHFLKILSYLLANEEVAGRRAIEYFEGKIVDPLVYSKMKRACSVPTETILFNIDDKAANWKDGSSARTALLRAFARVFYEHRCFFGENLNIARMEEFIDEQGRTDAFRDAVERIAGMPWTELRRDAAFYEDDIVEALQEVMDWSEQQARRPFERVEDDAFAPEDLVRQIAEYAERRSQEEGGAFRLLFMVDEVGQFIGGDVNLMLNLQTIVEDLGARCRGRVWVLVTSQEAIDEVTDVVSTDFSKIQGRFNTRLSLSSSSVDEVIKRRVLDKNAAAEALLHAEYERESAVLKNLFAFERIRADYVGYRDAREFCDTYPFVGYQFNLVRDILREIRLHSTSGKHLSGGERSMLSGFQESAQAVEERDTRALVPLWRFYDTFAGFVDPPISQVLDRCQRAADGREGLEPDDVAVLKTLYLVLYLDEVKTTVGNIATFMIESMDVDKLQLRERVVASLGRLVAQNYVSRSGDEYRFLTNLEQDVEREIKATDIDAGAVVESMSKIIFDDLYSERKLRVGLNDFPIDRFVDGAPHGNPQGGMKLEIVTEANPLSGADDGEIALASSGKAIIVLTGGGRYYGNLSHAAKIRKYVNVKSRLSLDSSVRRIIEDKGREAADISREAGEQIADAILNSRCAVDGVIVELRAAKAKDKIDAVLQKLAAAVYSKADFVDAPLQGKADLVKILSGTDQRGLEGTGGANQRADEEVRRYLDSQAYSLQQTSCADLQRYFAKPPYGWREIDIAGCLARLQADGWAEASRAGQPLDAHDPKLADYLSNRTERDRLRIGKRERVDEILLGRVRKLLRDLPGIGSVPGDEDGIHECAKAWLQAMSDRCAELLAGPYAQRKEYPGRDTVARGRALLDDLLQKSLTPKAFFQALADHDDVLLDFSEDFEPIDGFFPNQQRLFDEALDLLRVMDDDIYYLRDEEDVVEAIDEIRAIVAADAPYRIISNLPMLCSSLRAAHGDALSRRKAALLDRIQTVEGNILRYAQGKPTARYDASLLKEKLASRRGSISQAATLTKLAALDGQLDALQDEEFQRIDDEAAETPPGVKVPPAPATLKAKELRRSDVCPARVLSSEDEVRRYVAEIEGKLLAALDESGAVKLVG